MRTSWPKPARKFYLPLVSPRGKLTVEAATATVRSISDAGKCQPFRDKPKQAYAFYPAVYTTQDGTIKVAHAADPLGSSSGQGFWATLYGSAPVPALNLLLRFARNGASWIPNTLMSRKKMRGFFLLSADLEPDTESMTYSA